MRITLSLLAVTLCCGASLVGEPVPDLSLVLGAPRAIIGSTDDFIVVATLKNNSDVPAALYFGDSPTDYAIELHDGAGNPIPDSAFGRRVKNSIAGLSLKPLLAPGVARSVNIDVGEFFDISGPGTYSVKISRAAGYNSERLESNTVDVTILPNPGGVAAARAVESPHVTVPVINGSGPASQHIRMTINVDRSTMLSGKPISVWVTFTNPSPANLSLPSSLGSYYNFAVWTPDGSPATLVQGFKLREWADLGSQASSRAPQPIAGQYGSADIAQLFDMTQPGIYTVQAWIKVPEQFGGGELRSNVLSVTVRPR